MVGREGRVGGEPGERHVLQLRDETEQLHGVRELEGAGRGDAGRRRGASAPVRAGVVVIRGS